MAKRGRPTKYKSEYCEMIIEHMSKGKSLASFAASIGSYRELLYDWQKANPEFLHACKHAQELSLQWYEDFAQQAMTGRLFDPEYKGKYDKYNPNMLQFLMSRRFRDYNQNIQQNHNIDKENNSIKITYKTSMTEDGRMIQDIIKEDMENKNSDIETDEKEESSKDSI